jgi:hypothetical protein
MNLHGDCKSTHRQAHTRAPLMPGGSACAYALQGLQADPPAARQLGRQHKDSDGGKRRPSGLEL